MSELMDRAVIGMPFEMAMEGEVARRQFYSRAQSILAEVVALREEVEDLRARVVVVPERCGVCLSAACLWNDCLDELARLNGKSVSEGLLRRVINGWHYRTDAAAVEELINLLGERKEAGDVLVRE